ncbi:hypothetical protein [Streptomyces flavofungini]|uniref:hypothetical protein n=1 Tax=Streptomyces flavofungini TaxID=68200 RepID=UPI0025AFDCBD|nr:hypothetical protein [Streptomyces flavofungini]WJV47699.1 hypothetical protein QUY26_20520 [Streptomyces flavofungini]
MRALRNVLRRPGRRFVVADCGGTVDVVAYEVLGDGSLAQLARPSASSLGASYTTNAFIGEVLAGRFRGHTNQERLTRHHGSEFQELLSDWESHRNTSTVGSRENVALRVDGLHGLLSPDDLRHLGEVQGGKRDRIVVRPKEMTGLLESAVGGTPPLVDEHMEGAVGAAQGVADSGVRGGVLSGVRAGDRSGARGGEPSVVRGRGRWAWRVRGHRDRRGRRSGGVEPVGGGRGRLSPSAKPTAR